MAKNDFYFYSDFLKSRVDGIVTHIVDQKITAKYVQKKKQQ